VPRLLWRRQTRRHAVCLLVVLASASLAGCSGEPLPMLTVAARFDASVSPGAAALLGAAPHAADARLPDDATLWLLVMPRSEETYWDWEHDPGCPFKTNSGREQPDCSGTSAKMSYIVPAPKGSSATYTVYPWPQDANEIVLITPLPVRLLVQIAGRPDAHDAAALLDVPTCRSPIIESVVSNAERARQVGTRGVETMHQDGRVELSWYVRCASLS
jgi:hypothetical protein